MTYLIYKLWNSLILQASVKRNEQYVYLQKWSSSGSTFDSSHWPHPLADVCTAFRLVYLFPLPEREPQEWRMRQFYSIL